LIVSSCVSVSDRTTAPLSAEANVYVAVSASGPSSLNEPLPVTSAHAIADSVPVVSKVICPWYVVIVSSLAFLA
jgi:hypothetical protein